MPFTNPLHTKENPSGIVMPTTQTEGFINPYFKENQAGDTVVPFDYEKPVESNNSLADLNSDIFAFFAHPDAVKLRVRAAMEEAKAGVAEMRADEVKRQEGAGFTMYDSGEIQKKADEHSQMAADLRKVSSDIYEPKTATGKFLAGLTESLPPTLAGVAASSLTGPVVGSMIAIGLGAGQVGGQKYHKRKAMGDSPEEAANAALIHAGFEAALEATTVPTFVKLWKVVKAGKAILPAAARDMLVEGFQEVGTGLGQGTEDAWRGTGKDPAGIAGALEYYKSGQFAQDAAQNFLGGALISGGISATVLKPIQMSYKPKAIGQIQNIQAVIKEAEAQNLQEIKVGGQAIPVEKLKQDIADIKEAFAIDDSEIPTGSAVQDEEQAVLESAVKALKEMQAKLNSAIDGSIEKPIELTEVVEDSKDSVPLREGQSTLDDFLAKPEGTVEGFGTFNRKFESIVRDVHSLIGTKTNIALLNKSDFEKSDFKTYLEGSNHLVHNINGGRVFVGEKNNKRFYVVVADSKGTMLLQSSIVAHEALGHIATLEHFDSAPAEIKRALYNSFVEWQKGGSKPEGFLSPDLMASLPGHTPQSILELAVSGRDGESGKQAQLRLFQEFMAHQMSSSLQQRPEVRSIIQKYWAALYHKLSKIFAKFKEDYLDMATGIDSVEMFVDYLLKKNQVVEEQTIEESTQESVENFNTKDQNSKQDLVQAVFDSMFEVVDGKRTIKNAWRLKKLFIDGKTGAVSRSDIENSGYSYKELHGKTVVMFKKDVLFTIPWDHSRNLSQRSARMIATNIRDIFVLATLKPSHVERSKGNTTKMLNSETGKIIKVKMGRHAARVLEIMWERAALMASEEGITERQAFLKIMAGEGSAFSHLKPGVAGTVATGSLAKNMDRWIAMHASDLSEALQETPTIEPANDEEQIRKEHTEEVKQTEVSSEVSQTIDQVREIIETWWNKPKPSERIQDFEGLTQKVIFYFDLGGKDYTEVDGAIRNLVGATIKDVIQEKTGVEIQSEIKNKAIAKDKVRALKKAGMDTTIAEIELSSYDLFGDYEKVIAALGAGEALGSYVDNIDGFKKAYFSDRGISFVPLASGVSSPPGNGFIRPSWKRNSDADKLTLSRVIDHEDLFRVYPELKNLKVKFHNGMGGAGSADWENWTINVDYSQEVEVVRSTILHELQHIIQAQENWAGGQSMRGAKAFKDQLRLQRDRLRRDIDTFIAINNMVKAGKSYQEAMSDYTQANRFNGIKLQSANYIATLAADMGWENLSKELRQAWADATKVTIFDTGSAFGAYRHAAGEEEARRAEALFYLTDDEVRVAFKQKGIAAGSDISNRDMLYKTDARTLQVMLSATSTVEESSNDELMFASYAMLNSFDLKLTAKRKRAAKTIETGPYAYKLKSVPKAKVRKPRKVNPAKIEESRQNLFAFIDKMKIIKAAGEKKNLSMAEMMEMLGFQAKDIKTSLNRFNRHMSKFSPSETIIRLAEIAGLINEEHGREPLETLIKVMFPPQTVKETQADGTVKDVVYPGSDGTLQSLDSIAKDILINKLQIIISDRSGSRFDIESEESIAESIESYKQEWEKTSALKKLGKMLWAVQSSASDFLDSTKAGKELSFKLRRYLLTRTVMQRNYLVELNHFAKVFESPESRERLYKLHIGEESNPSTEELHFLQLIKSINASFGREMELHQVRVYSKDGSFKFFKYDRDMSDAYYPRMWKAEWFRNPTGDMIQSLLDAGEARDRQHAKRLIQDFNKQQIRDRKFANIERERETQLGGFILDPIDVYQKYVLKASARLASLKEFGSTPEVVLAQLSIRHLKESRDPEGLSKARDLINRVLGTKIEDQLLKEYKMGLSYGVMFSIGLLLQHAVFVQPGVAINMGAIAGYRTLIKGIKAVLPSLWNNQDGKNNKRWAELAGVLAFTVNRELNDIVADDRVRVKTDKILRSFGITQVDASMRIVGAIVGKMYATNEALRYIDRRDQKGYMRLRRLGISPEKVLQPGYLQSQEWFRNDLRMAALAFTEDTNFVLDPMRTPSIIQGHPLGKLFFLFKNFSFQQHRFLLKLIKEDRGKAIKSVLGGLTGGTIIMLLRLLMSGDDPEKVLEKDGIVKTAWRAFMAGGGAGIFAEAIGSALIPNSGPQTGLAVDSPVFGLLETAGKGSIGLYHLGAGDATDQDMHNLYRAATMGIQTGAIMMPDKVGIPLNAAIGFTRPMLEKAIAPSNRDRETSYLQR